LLNEIATFQHNPIAIQIGVQYSGQSDKIKINLHSHNLQESKMGNSFYPFVTYGHPRISWMFPISASLQAEQRNVSTFSMPELLKCAGVRVKNECMGLEFSKKEHDSSS
jgi:hypothetical protein